MAPPQSLHAHSLGHSASPHALTMPHAASQNGVAAPAPVPSSDPCLRRIIAAMPSALFAMASMSDGRRGALLVDRVMWCADEPPSIAVAVPKGHRLATLIRDSHSFALSLLAPTQRLIIKRIRECATTERAGVAGAQTAEAFAGCGVGLDADPFDTLAHVSLTTGAPILANAVAGLDCDVMRHFDLEADHEMYVGLVVGVRLNKDSNLLSPQTHALGQALSDNGVDQPTPSHAACGHASESTRRSENGRTNGADTNGYTSRSL